MGCLQSKQVVPGDVPGTGAVQGNQVSPDTSINVPEGLTINTAGFDNLLLDAKSQNTHKYRAANQDRQITRRGNIAKYRLSYTNGSLTNESIGNVISAVFRNKLNDSVLERCTLSLTSSDKPSEHELSVCIPVDAPIGFYDVAFKLANGEQCKVAEELIILLNPWHKDDPVYMENTEHLKEYILADHGLLFTGTMHNIKKRSWVFGQFTRQALDACALLLRDCDVATLRDPVLLSRAMSAKVNSQDDRGVLSGNWSGNYEGGTAPFKWTSAADILQQYVSSGGTPVKYGQCWVFSGVLTACLRSLGMPCRSVTNYSSGHDTQCNKTLDRYFHKSGEVDHRRTSDSVWNFHVWNEAWMDRPDLPAGRGGWQAIDSTPQERSEGIFQTGPASLAAIKEGEEGKYDNKFVFAEVNADVRYWEEDPAQPSGYRLVRTDPKTIGCNISTKKPGRNEREDVTSGYKYPEGSAMERAAVLHDMLPVAGAERGSVELKVELLDEDAALVVGEPVRVRLRATLPGAESQDPQGDQALPGGSAASKVSYAVYLYATDYRGGARALVKEVRAAKHAPFEEVFEVRVEEYAKFATEASMAGEIVCHAVIGAADSDEAAQPATFMDSRVFDLAYPALQVGLQEDLKVGEEGEVTVTFSNPLPEALTNCSLAVSGAGLEVAGVAAGQAQHFQLPESVASGNGKFEQRFKVKRVDDDPVRLVLTLNTDQVDGITGDIVLEAV